MIEIEDDLQDVCRDEDCRLDFVHRSHVTTLPGDEAPAPRRGRPKKRDPDAFRKHDPEGLMLAAMRALESTDWPLAFADIEEVVVHDYGPVTGRTIHRYLRRLIDKGAVMELDLGLTFQAYVRVGSRFIGDPDNLRENLLGRITQYHERRYDAA